MTSAAYPGTAAAQALETVSISCVASASFSPRPEITPSDPRAQTLVIFLLVGGAAYKTRSETGAALIVVLAAIAVTATVLAFFAVDTLRNAPETFIAIVGIAGLSVVLDLAWKHRRGPNPPATGSLDHTP